MTVPPAALQGGALATDHGRPAAASVPSLRARLVAFYTKYNPPKLASVDDVLRDYSGREEEMFSILVKKYGPEPPAEPTVASTAPPATRSSSADPSPPAQPKTSQSDGQAPTSNVPSPAVNPYRPRLVEFFEKHDPKRVALVDVMLEKFNGQEESLFDVLGKQYNEPVAGAPEAQKADAQVRKSPAPSPTVESAAVPPKGVEAVNAPDSALAPTTTETKVTADSSARNVPAKAAEADAKKDGKEKLDAVAVASASSDETRTTSHRERLATFLLKYNPERISKVDDMLRKYKGQEEAMFEALVNRYGPEPPSGWTPSPAPQPEVTTTGETNSSGQYRERLRSYFEKYEPAKVEKTDSMLQKYKGQEEAMFQALVNKYGPEPGVPVPPHRERLVAFF